MRYEWTMLYRKDGKDYVHQRLETLDPNEARRGHESSCEFLWVVDGMDSPYVTPLEAVDERGRTRIREGCAPGQDPKRVYRAVPAPEELRLALNLPDRETRWTPPARPATVEAPPPPSEAPSTQAEAPSKGHPWDS